VPEPAFHDGGKVIDAVGARLPNPFLQVRPGTFGGVELRRIGQEPHHGQPVRVRGDELPHDDALAQADESGEVPAPTLTDPYYTLSATQFTPYGHSLENRRRCRPRSPG
jgi:hypothetical protein